MIFTANGYEATKVRRGFYRTDIRCRCGGVVFADRNGFGEFRWEAYCGRCLTCDPNGWRTLRQVLQQSQNYFA